MSFHSPGVSEGGSGPSAQRDLEDSALVVAPGALQLPLPVMDVLSLGQGRLHQRAPSWAPDCPCQGCGCWGSAIPSGPCRVHVSSGVSTSPLRCKHQEVPHLPAPLPVLMQVLCHSRNLVRPSDRFVIQLVTERQGHVTNEHIQQAECLQSLIESVHNWELMWVRHTPCTGKDLPFKNPCKGGRGRTAVVPCPVLGSGWWHQGHTGPCSTTAPQPSLCPRSHIPSSLG